ncbi:esterase FE4 [Halyomorpha halys]|uniref:esterase FE4 n=1 Tax=Halyomorpha halys TaxID=286706 RepID=UPI0006D51D06|nr:esterase FE4-like [Halyomorpha halys]
MHLYIIFISYIVSFCTVLSIDLPEVSIEQGILRGLYTKTFRNRKIASFEGIPFGKPPLGKYRFKEPVPTDPWIGIYNATKKPPQCFQTEQTNARGSEDCLYLNVYTPQLTIDQPKSLNVIAFIHGGAFYAGKSTDVSPYLLLDRDLVLVTFNYRLGPLGFLSTEDAIVPGNNGLKDQLLALKWIKKNIGAFGGNPNNVTLGGVSAGGVSCHYHLLSPLSKGLFKRAFCMSGVALNPWAVAHQSKEKTMIIANQLGCPTNDSLEMVACLRDRPAEHIVALSKQFLYWGSSSPLVIFAPVIEHPHPNAFISESPIKIIEEGKGSDVPVLLSYALDEGLCGGTEILSIPGMFNELLKRWDEVLPHVLSYNFTLTSERKLEVNQQIKDFYEITNSSLGARNLIKMIGDRLFVAGISKTVKLSAAHYSSPVYLYRFSYRGKHSVSEFFGTSENLGVCHGDDMFYTLGLYNIFNNKAESDIQISNKMLDLWENFAAGDLDNEIWRPVEKNSSKIVFIDIIKPTNFQPTVAFQLGEESFWDCLEFNEIVN